MPRTKPIVISARASIGQAACIKAAARADGRTVNDWALRRLLEAARRRLERELEPIEDEAA